MSTNAATLKAELERQLAQAMIDGLKAVEPKVKKNRRPQASKGQRVQFGGAA